MKTIGIKLADGSFFPVLQEGQPDQKTLELTTAHNNQTRVMVDLYRSKSSSMDDAEYVDTLQIDNLVEHERGTASISFVVAIDEDNELSAKICDNETGETSKTTIELVNRTLEMRMAEEQSNFDITETSVDEDEVIVEETFSEEKTEEKEDSNAENSAVAGAVGGGLLAAAMLANEINKSAESSKNENEETESEEFIVPDFSETEIVDDTAAEDSFADEMNVDEQTFSEDFSESEITETTEDDSTVVAESTEEETIQDDFDLPDFSESETYTEKAETSSEESLFDIPDFEDETTKTESSGASEYGGFMFDEPESEPIYNDSESDSVAAGGISFTGLYDKETEMGESDSEIEEVKKKTRTPVIICVICAIICIIAVLLILFVIPSKLNILNKISDKTIEKVEEPVVVPPVVIPEPEEELVPKAKEDEVIVIEEAEEVIPEIPAPPVEEPKQDIIYKIKWGDTLWDIADTYYKNPWRYKKIANYNGIKDPDYIISGTRILIPQE